MNVKSSIPLPCVSVFHDGGCFLLLFSLETDCPSNEQTKTGFAWKRFRGLKLRVCSPPRQPGCTQGIIRDSLVLLGHNVNR